MNDISEIRFYKNGHTLTIKKIILTKEDIKYFFFPAKGLALNKIGTDEYFYIAFFSKSGISSKTFFDIMDLFGMIKNINNPLEISLSAISIKYLANKETYIMNDKTISDYLNYFKGKK